jgi:hypothetical protein
MRRAAIAAAALVLLTACAYGPCSPDTSDAADDAGISDAQSSDTSNNSDRYQIHHVPECSGDLGALVTCCQVSGPGPHPNVCGPCVEGDRGPDCTNAPPLCVCPSEQRCLGGNGAGVACANVFIPPERD